MSHAELDPHVLVSAKIGTNQKLLNLPGSRARWGWIVMLGHAKLQRPAGRFASLVQAKAVAGEYRDCVVHWLDAGLLHAAPAARACEKCGAAGDIGDDEVLVHNWHQHQERRAPSRTTKWRDRVGLQSGRENLSDVSPSVSPDVSPMFPSRAAARPLQSQSLSTELDGLDTVLVWLASRKVSVASGSRVETDLARLVDQHGPEPVIATMTGLPGELHDGAQYVYGARNVLNPIPSGKQHQEAAQAEDARARAEVRTEKVQRGMWERRLERFRNTGQWEEAWGPAPESVAS